MAQRPRRSRGLHSFILLAFTSSTIACTVSVSPQTDAPQALPNPPASETPIAHENLNSVLWMQTSAEYQASTRQAFRAAEGAVARALADPTWSAAVEQTGSFGSLPPAVIVDVDETVADNSAYEARLIRDHASYSTESWNAWVRERKARAIPGALEFARFAFDRGVTIFYVTNRDASVEEDTRENLEALGFPFPPGEDVLLTKGERPEWKSSDKTPRRAAVTATHRVLVLIGDNLADFINEERMTPANRSNLADRYRDRWGSRWIIIPNPSYGSWEGSLIGYRYGASPSEQLKMKRQALETSP